MRRRPAVVVSALALALALLSTGCGPKRSIQVGLRDYDTDVIYGAKKKPAPPPLVSSAEPAPLFPPPIIGLPAPIVVPAPRVGTTTTTTAPPVLACPEAPVNQIPPAATKDLVGAPKEGVYQYRVKRTTTQAGVTTSFAGDQRRTLVLHPQALTDTGRSWDIIDEQDGNTLTTTYQVHHPTGNPNLDGIYINHVVNRYKDGKVEEFAPSGFGLRIFALPADLAVNWRSVATDPIHGVSVALEATETEQQRINACGTKVEGWRVEAKIDKTLNSGGSTIRQVHTDQVFLVATQLGGLIIADTSHTTETAAKYDDASDATINSATPSPK